MSPDMKITQVKSNGKSLKNIELPDVMTAIRSGEQARVVNEHRGILSSSMPGDRNIHATDIPVLLFAARFRKKESRIEYLTSFYLRTILYLLNFYFSYCPL